MATIRKHLSTLELQHGKIMCGYLHVNEAVYKLVLGHSMNEKLDFFKELDFYREGRFIYGTLWHENGSWSTYYIDGFEHLTKPEIPDYLKSGSTFKSINNNKHNVGKL